MFGNASWFRSDSRSIAPAPRSLKGGIYYGLWLAVVCVPVIVLLIRGQFPESVIWTGIAVSVLLLDLRRLRKDIRQNAALERMHVIDDDGQPPHVETNKYVLEIRQ